MKGNLWTRITEIKNALVLGVVIYFLSLKNLFLEKNRVKKMDRKKKLKKKI